MKQLDIQNAIVVRQLMIESKMDRFTAMRTWYNSKTKKKLEENKMFWVSGMRAWWELTLELSNNEDWFRNPFDF